MRAEALTQHLTIVESGSSTETTTLHNTSGGRAAPLAPAGKYAS
jgi:hypothetical protein